MLEFFFFFFYGQRDKHTDKQIRHKLYSTFPPPTPLINRCEGIERLNLPVLFFRRCRRPFRCHFIISNVKNLAAEPHSLVGTVPDLRTGGRWLDPERAQNSFQGLMIVITTKVIPRSPLSIVSTIAMWKAAIDFERILSGVLIKRTPAKHG